ncbi:MAG: hypothetical protein IJD70_08730, partial [Clostridia bacterium]|nr:hypothetical protein [Clostridia bacterium]
MFHFIYSLSLSADFALANTIFDTLTSKTAILAYLLAVILIIIIIIFSAMFGKSPSDEQNIPQIALSPSPSPADTEDEIPETAERFCMLSEIDKKSAGYGHQVYEKGITLQSFCEDFRNY